MSDLSMDPSLGPVLSEVQRRRKAQDDKRRDALPCHSEGRGIHQTIREPNRRILPNWIEFISDLIMDPSLGALLSGLRV